MGRPGPTPPPTLLQAGQGDTARTLGEALVAISRAENQATFLRSGRRPFDPHVGLADL